MSFLEDVRAASAPNRPVCTISLALDRLTKAERAEAVDVIAGDFPGSAIAKVLTTRTGVKIQGQTVQRHRRGECTCGVR